MAVPLWSTATTLASSACSTQAWTSTAEKTSNWASGFVCHPVSSRSCSPFVPCRFKWSNDHRSVAPLINEAPLNVPVDRSCVCTSQQGCGKRYGSHIAGIFSCIFCILYLLFCRFFVFVFANRQTENMEYLLNIADY